MSILAGAKVDATDFTLPDPVSAFGAGANAIVSAANVFAVPASFPASVTITNPHPTLGMLCMVRFGAWVVANGQDTRVALNATGSNAWTAGSTGPGGTAGPNGYSEALIIVGTQANSNSHSKECSFSMVVPAGGSTTLEVQCMRALTTGTSNCNYPTVRVVPIRYV
jgi:hypothetical protein